MEINVYYSLDCRSHGKKAFSRRVEDFALDSFDFNGALRFLKCIFGTGCIVEFVLV